MVKGERLSLGFYSRDATQVAPDLLGKILVHQMGDLALRARVCEVEAYLGELDEASHAYRGRTQRNNVMFGPAGHIYVYFTYGMHYCANIVTGRESVAQAVLLRAAEPLEGIRTMEVNRRITGLRNLCSGPAKLVQAMGISKSDNGAPLIGGPIWFEDDGAKPVIAASPRIGISKATELPWRYYISDNAFVSKFTRFDHSRSV